MDKFNIGDHIKTCNKLWNYNNSKVVPENVNGIIIGKESTSQSRYCYSVMFGNEEWSVAEYEMEII